ncbi:MAG: hypothetical protein KDC48_14130, partial [Planctomycetes bacterium]|nr:hypothetical protein [Planctomycetota bacterium]
GARRRATVRSRSVKPGSGVVGAASLMPTGYAPRGANPARLGNPLREAQFSRSGSSPRGS